MAAPVFRPPRNQGCAPTTRRPASLDDAEAEGSTARLRPTRKPTIPTIPAPSVSEEAAQPEKPRSPKGRCRRKHRHPTTARPRGKPHILKPRRIGRRRRSDAGPSTRRGRTSRKSPGRVRHPAVGQGLAPTRDRAAHEATHPGAPVDGLKPMVRRRALNPPGRESPKRPRERWRALRDNGQPATPPATRPRSKPHAPEPVRIGRNRWCDAGPRSVGDKRHRSARAAPPSPMAMARHPPVAGRTGSRAVLKPRRIGRSHGPTQAPRPAGPSIADAPQGALASPSVRRAATREAQGAGDRAAGLLARLHDMLYGI